MQLSIDNNKREIIEQLTYNCDITKIFSSNQFKVGFQFTKENKKYSLGINEEDFELIELDVDNPDTYITDWDHLYKWIND